LAGTIHFTAIADIVEQTLSRVPVRQPRTIGDILEIDGESRAVARELVRPAAAAHH
jgi:1-deoxy-D-xylulose 5-phosphate reductoisomerase